MSSTTYITSSVQNYIVNGRLNKVQMLAKVMRMKDGLHRHQWYPEWSDNERAAAQMILNNVLDVLDEYWE